MITVHYLEQSRAQRVLWLLEEIGLDYEVKSYPRTAEYKAPAELLKLHPLGKSPILTDGDITLAESGAIFEHLIDNYGGEHLVPKRGTQEWRRYWYWMFAAEGSAMPLVKDKLVFAQIPKHVPWFLRPIASAIFKSATQKLLDPDLRLQLDYWESDLQNGGWFAGSEFSAADIMMSFVVEAGVTRMDINRPVPGISAYLENCRARPAYQKALARADGKYGYANAKV